MAGKNKKTSFGPGFLVTAAFIGPGTVTSCSLAGADFGFSLLFVLVFATVTTIILQQMTGRLTLGSGLDLGQSLREFPQHRLSRLFFIVLTLSSIVFGCAAYEAGNIIGGGIGLEIITSLPKRLWVILIASAAVFLLGRRKYKIVEKALVFLVCFMSLSFMMTMILIEPDFSLVLNGFLPTLPANSLYLALALVGTTVVPYNLFLHSSAVKQKWREKSDLGSLNKDLLLSVTLGGFISASIVVTSAVAFHQQGMEVLTGAHLARQLEPLFGSAAKILFGFGFFAAGLSSAITAPYAAAFACSGVLGWKGGQDDKGFRAVWLTVILAGLAVSLLDLKPLSVIVFAQVANGLLLPVASVFLLVVLNDRKRMGGLANNPRQNILGAIIILIVSFLGIWNIIKIFVK